MKSNRFATIRNQLKQFRLPFAIFMLFWVAGFLAFYFIEEGKNFWQIFLISVCAQSSETHVTFYNIYQILRKIRRVI